MKKSSIFLPLQVACLLFFSVSPARANLICINGFQSEIREGYIFDGEVYQQFGLCDGKVLYHMKNMRGYDQFCTVGGESFVVDAKSWSKQLRFKNHRFQTSCETRDTTFVTKAHYSAVKNALEDGGSKYMVSVESGHGLCSVLDSSGQEIDRIYVKDDEDKGWRYLKQEPKDVSCDLNAPIATGKGYKLYRDQSEGHRQYFFYVSVSGEKIQDVCELLDSEGRVLTTLPLASRLLAKSKWKPILLDGEWTSAKCYKK